MNIVILRHGEAESYAASDAERNLTAGGREQARLAGQCLQQCSLDFDQIWVSPYHRAQQTADGVMLSLPDLPRYTQAFLVPESSPAVVVDQLEAGGVKNLLIVSHQPLVSALVGVLEQANPRFGPPMLPASMVLLSGDVLLAGCCELKWVRHAPAYQVSGR